jgi:glutathione S-transferase
MTNPYVIYGGQLSYFTRKLEAACLFYGLEFEMRNKNQSDPANIEVRSGTHQVPVLQTPENWMIGDTTPIMHMLDGRYPDRQMYPAGSLGVLVQVVEEYFDEWVARTMVHYRWHYPECAEFASQIMADGNPAIAERMLSWGPRACRATGTDSDVQRKAAEAEYLRILEAAEKQLDETRYLMGDRPTAVDCIVLGGLRAHTHMDPVPKRVTANYPRVVSYSEGGSDKWDGSGDLPRFPETTTFGEFVLKEMVNTYQPYVLANGAAQRAGAKAFHADIYGEEVSYLSRPYPETSRQMIVDNISHFLDEQAQSEVSDWLESKGLRAFL